jgi:hypothetical protein
LGKNSKLFKDYFKLVPKDNWYQISLQQRRGSDTSAPLQQGINYRETLLAALLNFTGTVVLVSHDRHFLRCLINRVFEIDHGEMRIYNGNYEYYLEKSGREHRAA